jgi:hypothetical protein
MTGKRLLLLIFRRAISTMPPAYVMGKLVPRLGLDGS